MNERTRHGVYIAGFVAILLLIAVDVATGGDAAAWVGWLAAAIGLGTAGLAVKHTDGKGPTDG